MNAFTLWTNWHAGSGYFLPNALSYTATSKNRPGVILDALSQVAAYWSGDYVILNLPDELNRTVSGRMGRRN